MTAPAKPVDAWTEESEARLRWFAEITQGDTKQWSGPNDESPLPGLRADIRAALTEVSAAEARGYREGIERAAKMFDGAGPEDEIGALDAAAAIRALGNETEGG